MTMTTNQQTENRDIDVIHEFTDFDQFATVAEASALMGLDFDIATEIREDVTGYNMPSATKVVEKVRYWMVIVH